MRAGRFRQDLYYRPRLRSPHPRAAAARPPRRHPALAAHFLRKLRAAWRDVLRVRARGPPPPAAYPWPGNVRELENALHCAMLAARATAWSTCVTCRPPSAAPARQPAASAPPDVAPEESDEAGVSRSTRSSDAPSSARPRLAGGVSRAAKLRHQPHHPLPQAAEYGLEAGDAVEIRTVPVADDDPAVRRIAELSLARVGGFRVVRSPPRALRRSTSPPASAPTSSCST